MLSKIREEADEIEAALDGGNADELAEETGDLLFALVNLARHVGADPESALRGTNAKFERRFAYIERALAAKGRSLEDATLDEMDALWNEAKACAAASIVVPAKRSASRDPYRGISRLGTRLIPCAKSLPVAMGPCFRRDDSHATCGTASNRDTTMSRLVSSTRTVMSKRPS